MKEPQNVPKSLKAQITRTSLVLAAAALLREQGPKAVTYRKVAQWAGAASSSVGYYFSSVTELLHEAGQYNIQLRAQRAEKAAVAAEALDTHECRNQVASLLVQACLPDRPAVLSAHYAQLIAAANSPMVTEAYRKGRTALDAAIARILTHANVPLEPRIALALVDGAAVEALSEGYDVREMAANILTEAIECATPSGEQ